MSRKTLLSGAAGLVVGGIVFGAGPAVAQFAVIDGASIIQQIKSFAQETGILNVLQAVQTIETAMNDTMKAINAALGPTTYGDTNTLLREGFTQNANYAKGQVGAQQQIADATNTAMARVQRDFRNAQIRDQQTPNVQQCTALDSGQVVAAAAQQGWRTGQTIGAVMDPRREGLPGTPAYFGAAQAAEAANQVHLSRYCSPTEAQAGLCTVASANLVDADQRASSLFGNDNLIDQTGVNVANDFATNLIEPKVPAALRGDQLTSVSGQDAALRRRNFNSNMSLARLAVDQAIGEQTPGVLLSAQQKQLLTDEGLTVPASGSWFQALNLEATRRISDTSWAASLQAMPPASVQREIAMELALNNYLLMQQYRSTMLHTTIAGAQLAIAESAHFQPTTEMPSPALASK